MASTDRQLPCELQNGESVILLTRRHWLYLWSKLAVQFASAFIPVAVVREFPGGA